MKEIHEDESHPTVSIDLDTGLTDCDTKVTKWYDLPSKSICKSLRFYLSESLKNTANCSKCGGLLPDLCIAHRGRAYLFTCTKIEEEGKVLAETDYGRLGAHAVFAVWQGLDEEERKKLEPTVKQFLLEWNSLFTLVEKV